MHIDVGGAERETLIERLTHEAPGLVWTIMQDPEGNEFCVSIPGA